MVIRMTGLSSGMDTDALIKQLMEVERIPMYRLEAEIDFDEDKLIAWTQVEKEVSTLSSKATALETYTSWQQMSVTSADEDKMTATATTNAANATYSIAVTQLATKERYNSAAQATADEDLGYLGGSFTINGQIVILTDNYTLNDVRDAINLASVDMSEDEQVQASVIGTTMVLENAKTGTPYTMTVADEVGSTILSDLGMPEVSYTGTQQASDILALNLDGSFSVNGFDVDVDLTDSLTDIMNKINTATGSTLASVTDSTLTIADASVVGIKDTSGNVLASLGFTGMGGYAPPVDMEGVINGIDVSSATNSGVTEFIQGVTFNFTTVTEVDKTVDVSVANDTASIKEKIEEFITAYNDTMEAIEEQSKVELSTQGDVESTSLLQGDSLLRTITGKSRDLIGTIVETGDGLYKSLRAVGIGTTGSDNRISIVDSSKLDDALTNHFDELETLFRDRTDVGVLRQIDEYFNNISKPDGTIANRKGTIRNSIDDRNKRITQMESQLTRYEDGLYAQFGAMEEAIGRMEAQSGFLSGMMG